MVSADDFSFPKITNPLPHLAISPSLWRVSSIVYPEDDRASAAGLAPKTLSCLENDVLANKEEKMDMLWEDFNEDLPRVPSLSKNKQLSESPSSSSSIGDDQELQLCFAQALTMSRPGRVFQPKKQRSFFLVKVLKKILLFRNHLRSRTTN